MSNSSRLALAVFLMTTLAAGTATAQSAGANQAAAATVEGIQGQILADPQLAGRVESLRDDPRVAQVLADPEVVEALQRGDFAALLAHPKIRRLASDPAVQDLTREIVPAK